MWLTEGWRQVLVEPQEPRKIGVGRFVFEDDPGTYLNLTDSEEQIRLASLTDPQIAILEGNRTEEDIHWGRIAPDFQEARRRLENAEPKDPCISQCSNPLCGNELHGGRRYLWFIVNPDREESLRKRASRLGLSLSRSEIPPKDGKILLKTQIEGGQSVSLCRYMREKIIPQG